MNLLSLFRCMRGNLGAPIPVPTPAPTPTPSPTPTPTPTGSWANPLAAISFGRLTRVGYGARDEIGYQGAGNVTIAGTNSSHWQWSASEKCVVPKNGAGATGTAWVASPDPTYTLTLTDTDTGQACVLTITTDASAADVSSYAQGQATLNAVPFGSTVYWKAGFHARGSADQRIAPAAGFTGANWKICTVRGAALSATIANQRMSSGTGTAYGIKYLNLILEDRDLVLTGNAVTGAIEIIGSSSGMCSDLWIESCLFAGTYRKTTFGEEPRGLNGVVKNVTLKNCTSVDVSYVLNRVAIDNCTVDGLSASRFQNDIIHVVAYEESTTCNSLFDRIFVFDVDVPPGSAAHCDFIQILTAGTSGKTLPGEIIIQRSAYLLGTGLYECNFLFGNQSGVSTAAAVVISKLTIRALISVGTTANNPGINIKVNDLVIDHILSTRDVNNPKSTQDSNIYVPSTVVNATVTNCVANNITLQNTGTTTTSNNLLSVNTDVEQAAVFADPYIGAGGSSLHGDWSTITAMLADLSARYAPIGGATAGPFDSAGAWAGV